MEHKFKCIDNSIKNKRITKIPCRNSYERRIIHDYADSKNLSHRSIIDYTRIHINQKHIEKISDGTYYDTNANDRFEMKISMTPYSFVEINNGYEKEIIGTDIIPNQMIYNYYGDDSWYLSKYKKEFKDECLKAILSN